MAPILTTFRRPFVPLDFLKRKNTGDKPASTPVAAAPMSSITLPEEVVAQEFQLKLYTRARPAKASG